jgi:S1-C subfamily serine protease
MAWWWRKCRKVARPLRSVVEDLSEIFVDFIPGDEVEVKFTRDGEKMSKTVTLARLGTIYKNQRR